MHSMSNALSFPRFVADIGGTNARFAIEVAPFEFQHTAVLPCADYHSLTEAIHAYLTQWDLSLPAHVGIAIANPIRGDHIQMTNRSWSFSIAEMKGELGCETLFFVNDFTAQSLAITQMSSEYVTPLKEGDAEDYHFSTQQSHAVVGPGTGLGVSGLIPNGKDTMVALASEGGHVSFAPADDIEEKLLEYASKEFNGHVSAERFLQGSGLSLIHRCLAKISGVKVSELSPAEITHRALAGDDALCIEVLQRYCAILGSFCGNATLTIGGFGGLYITGGIIPRFIDFLRHSEFHTRFCAKGRFSQHLQNVPIFVIEHPYPGILGAAVALNSHLQP